jgi:hypothetical protein
MKVWRTITERRDGASVVAERVELSLEELRSEAEGGAPGLAAARLDDADGPPRHWMVFRFPAHTETALHRTPTVDYVTVLEGELDLVVPDQAPVRLRQGDCVVQRGAVHAWRTSEVPAVLSAVVIQERTAGGRN